MASRICGNIGKTSWPELVGVQGNFAKNTIDRQNRRVTAVIVPEGSNVTQEVNCARVRVWVNRNGVVTRVPFVG